MAETSVQTPPFESYAAFADWEAAQEDPYEYVDGYAYAMSGGSGRHNVIKARIIVALGNALAGSDCVPLSPGQRIQAVQGKRYYYADASVVCGAMELDPKAALSNPTVLFEVLSRSTEGQDYGRKRLDYQLLTSLQDYLLVSQWDARIEHFVRHERGWKSVIYTAGDRITLAGCDVSLSVDEIYEGVWRFPSDEDA